MVKSEETSWEKWRNNSWEKGMMEWGVREMVVRGKKWIKEEESEERRWWSVNRCGGIRGNMSRGVCVRASWVEEGRSRRG